MGIVKMRWGSYHMSWAATGDPVFARQMCATFSEMLRSGELDDDVRDILAAAFEAGARGESLDEFFYLKTKGRGRKKAIAKRRAVFAAVQCAQGEGYKLHTEGGGAFSEVGTVLNMSPSEVSDLYYKSVKDIESDGSKLIKTGVKAHFDWRKEYSDYVCKIR